ncbi:MAG: di-heme oxidoredictase family protein [Verrucomicrobiales bacterium]
MLLLRVLRSAFCVLTSVSCAFAQLTERPGSSQDNPIDSPRDLSGFSIKTPRLRLIHTEDDSQPGGTMWMQQRDPWLAYQWGRSLFQREFTERDGVYGEAGKLEGMRLRDGATKIASRSHVNSCATCHSNPYRDAGAGTTIAKNGGTGRNTPHLFGAGLLEMLGQQLRADLTKQADANRDGWISLEEAKNRRASIVPAFGARRLDFGGFDDGNNDGRPDLNDVVWPIFVDEQGARLPTASSLKTEGVAGYRIDVQVFGFGHLYLPNRPPLASTLRTFASNTYDLHLGLQAFDPTCLDDPDGDGFSRPSNAGCEQPMTQAGRDRGKNISPSGLSRDDPDRDGYCHEMTEGELDVSEWFQLNHPRPGRGEITAEAKAGERRFAAIGCATCHVPGWQLREDRRFFDLEVAWRPSAKRVEGKVVRLSAENRGRHAPKQTPFLVNGLYSDLRYHDMGEDFAQLQYDGSVVRLWRTTPLWGVAHTGPYGHDGASMSLHDVILRHGGEAQSSRDNYARLNVNRQRGIIAFLESLILYQTDVLPCDVDADGEISSHFIVADKDTGPERLNPEWLFRIPGRIEGPILNNQTGRVVSYALTNIRQAYGLDLPLLLDADADTFPDVIDPDANSSGFLTGVR